MYHFNPRTPVGCDRDWHGVNVGVVYFNPRTPVGCDSDPNLIYPGQVLFQSTHPSGVRLENPSHCRFNKKKFQSTHPSGVRLVPKNKVFP